MIEPVIARAEQQMAAAMSPLVLETLIDDILIVPLIMPEAEQTPAAAAATPITEAGSDRPAVQASAEVVVELDVAREDLAKTPSIGVRRENGSAPAMAIDRVPLEPVELPDPSDIDASSDPETMVEIHTSTTPADIAPPFDDDENFAVDEEPAADDATPESSGVRKRTPPAMPLRQPASAIPKAVSAGGRPLPRAYVAKRRVTPPANPAIPQVDQPTAEPESVAEPVASPPVAEPEATSVIATPIESTAPEPAQPTPQPIVEESSALADIVRNAEPSPAPPAEPADEVPSTSESVWGVTVVAPVVAKPSITEPTITEPTVAARPAQFGVKSTEIPAETAPRPEHAPATASTGNSNTSITIMVVALVILAVSVFVLLRR
jgi:hypothetical protein